MLATLIRTRRPMSSPDGPGDGVFVIDKPVRLTSQQVVSRLKHRLGVRKAGHAGTLDPMATGVLVVGVGKATRLLGYIAGTDKQYTATIRLGQATTTDDAEGEPIGSPVDASGLDDEAISVAMANLTGQISQTPSAVSAIKVDGRRAYALVRSGLEVSLASRPVTVARFDLVGRSQVGQFVDLDVVVDCSTGTYVRALARDLGIALGVGAHLTKLRRTRVGRFDVTSSVALDQVGWPDLEPMELTATRSFAWLTIDDAQAADVSHGRPLALVLDANPTALLSQSGQFLALYRPDGQRATPVAVMVGGDQ